MSERIGVAVTILALAIAACGSRTGIGVSNGGGLATSSDAGPPWDARAVPTAPECTAAEARRRWARVGPPGKGTAWARPDIHDLDAAPDGDIIVAAQVQPAFARRTDAREMGEGSTYIARLDPCGGQRWLRRVGETGNDSRTVHAVALDDGGIGFAVSFVTPADFGTGTLEEPYDFVAYGVLEPDGAPRWVRSAGGEIPIVLDARGEAMLVGFKCGFGGTAPGGCERKEASLQVVRPDGRVVWFHAVGFRGVADEDRAWTGELLGALGEDGGAYVVMARTGGDQRMELDGEPLPRGTTQLLRFDRAGAVIERRGLDSHVTFGVAAVATDGGLWWGGLSPKIDRELAGEERGSTQFVGRLTAELDSRFLEPVTDFEGSSSSILLDDMHAYPEGGALVSGRSKRGLRLAGLTAEAATHFVAHLGPDGGGSALVTLRQIDELVPAGDRSMLIGGVVPAGETVTAGGIVVRNEAPEQRPFIAKVEAP